MFSALAQVMEKLSGLETFLLFLQNQEKMLVLTCGLKKLDPGGELGAAVQEIRRKLGCQIMSNFAELGYTCRICRTRDLACFYDFCKFL